MFIGLALYFCMHQMLAKDWVNVRTSLTTAARDQSTKTLNFKIILIRKVKIILMQIGES